MERHALGKSQPAMPPSKAVEAGEKARGVEAKVKPLGAAALDRDACLSSLAATVTSASSALYAVCSASVERSRF